MAERDERLKRQRILIVLAAVLAFLFAAGNIIASLGTWREQDAAATTTLSPE